MERIVELNWYGQTMIQNDDYFPFAIDAIILSYYAPIVHGMTIMDFGTGNGIIPILLHGRADNLMIYGIDIISENIDLAVRNVSGCGNVVIDLCDICVASKKYPKRSFDMIVSNPPYNQVGQGRVSPNKIKAISKVELCCKLDDILREASLLLKDNGVLVMIYRIDRLEEIKSLCVKYGLVIKSVRIILPTLNSLGKIMYIELIKGYNSKINYLDPLIIYDDDHNYTEQMKMIYAGDFGGDDHR